MFYRRRPRRRKAPKARTPDEKCSSKWCRNRRARKQTHYKDASGNIRTYESFLPCCWNCQTKNLREKNPWPYVLNGLRGSAKRRKLPFTLTLAEFKQWCAETGYIEKRGHKPGCFTVDRKDRNEGYHIWNIQMMEFLQNSQQGEDNTPRSQRGAATVEEPLNDNEPF